MNRTLASELTAALNDFAEWLCRHEDVPGFCDADFSFSHVGNRWTLKLMVHADDNDQVLKDLAQFAALLGGTVITSGPRITDDGRVFHAARVIADASDHLHIEVWGHLHGPDALTMAA
jgi:hypothetical protein